MSSASILNRPGETRRQTLKAAQSDTAALVLPLIVLIVLVIFLGGMLYLLISSQFQTTNPEDPVSTDTRARTTITCPPGQCATNIFSGFKTCPTTDASLVVSPAESVCNSRFLCDNPLTPYALQSDLSTDINGVCESIDGVQVECPCLRVSQCPEYVLSVFTTSNGNPYQQLQGQRITFPQQSSYVSTSGDHTDIPPIQFTNPALTFCAAPLSYLPLSNPGCNFVSAPDGNSMTYKELLLCMGQAAPGGCSGLIGNACLQGTLALVTNTPETLTQASITSSQFACVRGESCPCGQITIFDTNFGGIVCRSLPPGPTGGTGTIPL